MTMLPVQGETSTFGELEARGRQLRCSDLVDAVVFVVVVDDDVLELCMTKLSVEGGD
jgi:hypothetical protein